MSEEKLSSSRVNAPFYPEGRYRGRGIAQGFTHAITSGNPVFKLRFRVLSLGDRVDNSLPELERMLYLPLTEKTIDRSFDDLEALGFIGETLDGLDSQKEGFFNFAGREFELICRHEKDQDGNLRERWGVPPAERPLSKDKLRELDRLWARRRRKANGSVAAIATPPEACKEGVDDSDVPF
jgi:hypothetical protein